MIWFHDLVPIDYCWGGAALRVCTSNKAPLHRPTFDEKNPAANNRNSKEFKYD
jgi:hypothetical protein